LQPSDSHPAYIIWILLTNSPDLHSQPTTAALLSLLLAPITSYISILTLLAIPAYTPLLAVQPYATRLSIGQAVVSSVLKNNTQIETPEDVSGVLGLCQVLVKDQKEGNIGGQSRRNPVDVREMAEEQGWVARMVHLFRSDDLGVQFEVCELAFGCGRGGGIVCQEWSLMCPNSITLLWAGAD
jgi:vacuolar protein sorting-associated protein 35